MNFLLKLFHLEHILFFTDLLDIHMSQNGQHLAKQGVFYSFLNKMQNLTFKI